MALQTLLLNLSIVHLDGIMINIPQLWISQWHLLWPRVARGPLQLLQQDLFSSGFGSPRREQLPGRRDGGVPQPYRVPHVFEQHHIWFFGLQWEPLCTMNYCLHVLNSCMDRNKIPLRSFPPFILWNSRRHVLIITLLCLVNETAHELATSENK